MYGLVLEGGGAKGAYHIGAYYALKELGYEFDAIVGVSIGAINAAMIVSGEVDKCAQLWRNMTMSNYFEDNEDIENSKAVVDNKNDEDNEDDEDDEDIFSIIKNLKHKIGAGPIPIDQLKKLTHKIGAGTIPIDPLRNLVYNEISEEKIRKSKTKFGLVTLNISDKKGEELFAEDIKKGELLDYIIASSYLPIFKMEPLNGKYYLDGGFFNKIPYNMVEDLGLKPVIVRVNPKDIRDLSFPKDAIIIEPREKLNSTMNFDLIKSDQLIRRGYFDTYRIVKNLLGKDYYIESFSEDRAYKILKNILFEKIKENKEEYKYTSPYRAFFEEVIPKIAKEYNLKSDYTLCHILSSIVEEKASEENKDKLRIYSIDELIKDLKLEDFKLKNNTRSIIKELFNE